jgi:hypothetical protein
MTVHGVTTEQVPGFLDRGDEELTRFLVRLRETTDALEVALRASAEVRTMFPPRTIVIRREGSTRSDSAAA